MKGSPPAAWACVQGAEPSSRGQSGCQVVSHWRGRWPFPSQPGSEYRNAREIHHRISWLWASLFVVHSGPYTVFSKEVGGTFFIRRYRAADPSLHSQGVRRNRSGEWVDRGINWMSSKGGTRGILGLSQNNHVCTVGFCEFLWRLAEDREVGLLSQRALGKREPGWLPRLSV